MKVSQKWYSSSIVNRDPAFFLLSVPLFQYLVPASRQPHVPNWLPEFQPSNQHSRQQKGERGTEQKCIFPTGLTPCKQPFCPANISWATPCCKRGCLMQFQPGAFSPQIHFGSATKKEWENQYWMTTRNFCHSRQILTTKAGPTKLK